jgi:two-component system chemotaxis response regulator CheY
MKKPVLIVDDDETAREALAAFLEAEGYPVLEAANGREALDQLQRDSIGAILLDLMMPVMDGWEFRAAQIRDPDLARVPVMVITADASARSRAMSLGVEEYMTKPIQFPRLLQFVARHC